MKIKPITTITYQTFPLVDAMIEITDEQYAGLQAGTHRFNDSLTEVVPKTQAELETEESERIKREEEENLESLRSRRSAECFSVINRGELWYDRLSGEQVSELNKWYQAWLDVTDTGIIPEKPEWVK